MDRLEKLQLEMLSEYFESLQRKVSKFEYDLKRFETYRDFEERTLLDKTTKTKFTRPPHRIYPLYRKLKIIKQLPNLPEIRMYSALKRKCHIFRDMMMHWLQMNRLPDGFNGTRDIDAGHLFQSNLASPPMVWEVEKIDIILEEIKDLMIKIVEELTGVDRDLAKKEISEEVEAFAKIFLWLILKDQKRYKKIYPKGMKFEDREFVDMLSYIDQSIGDYCPNIFQCLITEEVDDYLSSQLTNGMMPETTPETIRNRTSCSQSRANKYAVLLNQMWSFMKEMDVKIGSHKIYPKYHPYFWFNNERSTTGSVYKDSHDEPAPGATAQEELKKRAVQVFVEALVSRIFEKPDLTWSTADPEAITMRLFERTWVEVQDVNFKPKTLKQLDEAIFKFLCENWGGSEKVQSSMRLEERELGNCIASQVEYHLTRPKKRSKICKFFSSVGKGISNIFICGSDVQETTSMDRPERPRTVEMLMDRCAVSPLSGGNENQVKSSPDNTQSFSEVQEDLIHKEVTASCVNSVLSFIAPSEEPVINPSITPPHRSPTRETISMDRPETSQTEEMLMDRCAVSPLSGRNENQVKSSLDDTQSFSEVEEDLIHKEVTAGVSNIRRRRRRQPGQRQRQRRRRRLQSFSDVQEDFIHREDSASCVNSVLSFIAPSEEPVINPSITPGDTQSFSEVEEDLIHKEVTAVVSNIRRRRRRHRGQQQQERRRRRQRRR